MSNLNPMTVPTITGPESTRIPISDINLGEFEIYIEDVTKPLWHGKPLDIGTLSIYQAKQEGTPKKACYGMIYVIGTESDVSGQHIGFTLYYTDVLANDAIYDTLKTVREGIVSRAMKESKQQARHGNLH